MRRRSEGYLPSLPRHEDMMKPRFSTIEEIITRSPSESMSRLNSVDPAIPAKNPLERLESVLAALQENEDHSDADIVIPSAEVLHNPDGTITFQYKPVDIGTHELNAWFNNQVVSGTPFICHVDKVDSNFVSAYGPGLLTGSVGVETEFEVISKVGSDIDVNVTGPVSTIVNLKTTGVATRAKYRPVAPGEHSVSVLYEESHMRGSPFNVVVSGEGHKKSKMCLSATSEVSLGVDAIDLANVVSMLKTPHGEREPCLLVVLPDGKLGVANFVPYERGLYEVEITRDDEHIARSPFPIVVGESQLCSASKVKVTGDTRTVLSDQWNTIQIDISRAGYGPLAISIDGAYRTDMQCMEKARHVYVLQYRPHEPGLYLMNILFGDDNVPGSPIILEVGGQASGRQRALVSKEVSAVMAAQPGSRCEVLVRIPGTSCLDMEAILVSPDGCTDECEIKGLDDCVHDIAFVPAEDGVYVLSLKHKGLHVAGSPFQYTVGRVPNGGQYKVQCGGAGLAKGETYSKNEFNIYTREAGAGTLSVGIDGASKAEIHLTEQASGFWAVTYTVSKPGMYNVGIKWNNEHVHQSPYTVVMLPQNKDAKLVAIQGLRDRGTELGKPVTFNVTLNGARGTLTSTVKTPGGQVKDVTVQELDRDLYILRFVPVDNGVHYVNVMLSEADVSGSPFALLVGKLNADPGLVHAHGNGLITADTGFAAKFKVVTVNSGAGTLGVFIDGPSRVPIMCMEDEEGYEFSYTPSSPGDYFITIKYCNFTIAGCPYKAIVTGRGKRSAYTHSSSLSIEAVEKKPSQSKNKRFVGDPSKVIAAGPGLKKAYINKPCNFTVDVKNAGNAALAVSMISAAGQLVEELSYKVLKGTVYQVNYKTKEKGDYILHILWGSEEILGSPFIISSGP